MNNYQLSIIIDCEDKKQELVLQTLHSINTEKPIEIILLNCEETLEKEEKITYIHEECLKNALKKSKEIVSSEYVYFLTAGDCFYKDSFERLYNILCRDEYDVVTCSIYNFRNLYQMELEYNTQNSKQYTLTQFNQLPIRIKSTFLKNHLFKKYSFPEELDHSFENDLFSKVMNSQKLKCFYVSNSIISFDESISFISCENVEKTSFFLQTIQNQEMLTSVEEYYTLIELKKYLTKSTIKYYKSQNQDDQADYIEFMKKIVSKISTEMILNISSIIMPYKNYLLELKYGDSYTKELYLSYVEEKKKKVPYVTYKNIPLFKVTEIGYFKINILESKNNILVLDGLDSLSYLKDKYQLVAVDDKNRVYYPKDYRWTLTDREGFVGETIYYGKRFKFEIPLNDIKQLNFELRDKDNHSFELIPSFGTYAKLVKKMKMSYYAKDSFLFRYRKKGIAVSKNTFKSHLKAEVNYLLSLLKMRKYSIIWIRLVYQFMNFFKKKPIWLIRDNEKRAKDSGAEMFKYYSRWDKKDEIKAYFILDKNCPDYNVMKKYGKIIQPDSFKYKLYHMLADKLIDTRGGISAKYIFKDDTDYVKDLCDWDYIWLIHGIMTRNESTWTNKYVLNAKLFATCNEREYQSVLDELNGYGYDENEVFLTGLPRHDALSNHKKKKILFLPTWRKHLAGDLIPGSSDRSYVANFKETDYYQFYNSLINDERLLKVMRENDFTGDFYLHPSFMKQSSDFVENDLIHVGKEAADANRLVGECSILITDYSSVQFEGAYLDTPVVYPQYDADTFGENHTGKDGYFEYVQDGFGPVCYNLDETVNAIIDIIHHNCQNQEPYKTRAKEFFVYKDNKNSERVFNQILKLDGKNDTDVKTFIKGNQAYLYQGNQLKKTCFVEEKDSLYNAIIHITTYVDKIEMKDKSFVIKAGMVIDERDYVLPHRNFKINIGTYNSSLKLENYHKKHGCDCYDFEIEVTYNDILLTKKSTPIYLVWEDGQGYGYRTNLKYQYTKRLDTLANRSHRVLHYSDVKICEDIKTSIFLRETIGNNVYLCVRDINVTDYDKERKKLKYAYWLSHVFFFHKAKKSVLCFEKFSSKYEESASVLFEKIIDNGHKNTYFVIDKESIHYQNIPEKYKKYIIEKYTFKHYFYFFLCKTFIATESMNHMIELNISDPNVTLKITKGEYDYIFLQHGVMYMYCLENRSDFIKGQGFTKSSKIVVSSQTEANHFIEYGDFDQEDMIISGLPKFDRSVRNPKADKILIMPTSRDFEYNVIRLTPTESTYYKFVKNIIDAVPEELKSKIVVVGHPLLKDQLLSTDLNQYIPDNYIYNDLLKETKLLITDYSSISYDAFYRGSNVIFCWEDKNMCLDAMGYKLMLNDDNVFADVSYHFDDLTNLIRQNYYHSPSQEHVLKYRDIVTYHDNQNTKRCYDYLVNHGYYGKVSKQRISRCKIKNFTKKVYSGEKRIHTKLEVYDGTKLLVKNKDYKIYYFNNKRRSKYAFALFVGIGNYYGFKLRHFRICDTIMSYTVSGVEFKNNEIQLDHIAVRNDKNKYLRRDIDYVIEEDDLIYENVKGIIVRGKKNYAGTIELLFECIGK